MLLYAPSKFPYLQQLDVNSPDFQMLESIFLYWAPYLANKQDSHPKQVTISAEELGPLRSSA